MEITSAWVRVIGDNPQGWKVMAFESIVKLCNERDLVVCKNGKFFDVDEYTFRPEIVGIQTYGFVTGHYSARPHIELAPRGTKIEYGQYVLPDTEFISY